MAGGKGPTSQSPWLRYVEAAVRGPLAEQEAPVDPPRGRSLSGARGFPAVIPARRLIGHGSQAVAAAWQNRAEATGQPSGTGTEASRRRTDVRLALPAMAVWAASVAGLWLQPPALATLCGTCAALGILLLASSRRASPPGVGRGVPAGSRSKLPASLPPRRSLFATGAVALFLAAVAAAHSAVASTQRFEGALADAVATGKSVVAVVEVAGAPRALAAPGQAGPPGRWSVPVLTVELSTGGVLLRTRAQVTVMGGDGWGTVVPGQLVRTTGKLRTADPGREEAGILTASSGPGQPGDPPILQKSARELRERFVAAASFLAPDPRGLLPGMVTGDTSALDEGLEAAMKTVGMSHLTAVSGANCSLVLGALLLACRGLRLPRLPAAAAAGAGLCLFVVLVGPDASVLRAALMGAVAVIALASGRSGRGLSFLCLAVIGLLLFDPGLGTSFGFLLSVLATAGIIILGRRIIDWTPPVVPRWVAAAVAVPLSAQLLCGPVTVLLQPQFSTYSLLANVIASPLVAPVTLLGTAAVPLVVTAPWAAAVLIAVAGTFSAGVAAAARFSSQLPGAALPWPDGVPGLFTMMLLSVLTYGLVWAVARPRRCIQLVVALHGRTVSLLEATGPLAAKTLGRRTDRAPAHLPQRSVRPLGPGLERGAGRGRLGYCIKLSGRNPRWPLHQSERTVPRHRMQPPGAM